MKKRIIAAILVASCVLMISCGKKDLASNSESTSTQAADTKEDNSATTNIEAKKETSLIKVNSQEIAFKQYLNGRYGYSLSYPNTFTIKQQAENGDGVLLISLDNTAEITVSGVNNNSKTTVKDEYDNIVKETENVTYRQLTGNWFAISWTEGKNTIYRKTVVGKGSKDTFIVKYPTNQKDYYEKIIEYMSANFKTPGVENIGQ